MTSEIIPSSKKVATALEAMYGPTIVGTVPLDLLREEGLGGVQQFDVVVVTSARRGPVPELGFVLDFEEGEVLVGVLSDPEAVLLPPEDLTVVASTDLAERVRRARGA